MSDLNRSYGDLRRLLDEATPRPWKVRRYDHGGGRVSDEATDRVLIADLHGEANRELILAAVEALPVVLTDAERMRDALLTVYRVLLGLEDDDERLAPGIELGLIGVISHALGDELATADMGN